MISRKDLSKYALIFPTESITFGELVENVARASSSLKSDLLFLKADQTIDFITQFLAAIDKGVPCAIFPTDIEEEDLKYKNKVSYFK